MNEHKTMTKGAAQLVITEAAKEILDSYLELRLGNKVLNAQSKYTST